MSRKVVVARCRSMVPAAVHPVTLVRTEGKPTTVRGYAAVFYRADNPGTEYWLFKDLVERVGKQAFDRAIQEKDDARALFNHDPNQVMGRLSAGTLRLKVDDIGLGYEFDLPDSPNGKNLETSLERKDVTGSSFAFDLLAAQYSEERDFYVREMLDVRLYDVGPVTFPAYSAATAGIRSAYKPAKGAKRSEGFDDREEARQELRSWLKDRGPSADEVEVTMMMARAKSRMCKR